MVEELDRVKLPNRERYVRVGDTVEVKPSRPRRRDGYRSVVRKVLTSKGIPYVEVVDQRGNIRSVTLDKLGVVNPGRKKLSAAAIRRAQAG